MSEATSRAPFELPDVTAYVVGVLGGTGEQGRGLATWLARMGQSVIIGSRNEQRAVDVAAELNVTLSSIVGASATVRGADNAECASRADVVIVAVPWDGHRDLLLALADQLADKIVIDCVNPLGFDKQGPYALAVDEGSATQQAAACLPRSRVVGAFHHISAVLLLDLAVNSIDTDVLVVGDDREATDVAQALASRITGVRGIYAGRLRNAHQIEAMTANLISMNRRYKSHSGIRVTDV